MNHVARVSLLLVVAATAVVCAKVEVSDRLKFNADEEGRIDRLFQVFRETFDKKYDNVFEHLYRRSIFQDNLQYIEEHNRQFAKGKYSYTLGVNEFTDLKHEEFLELYTSRITIVTSINMSQVGSEYDVEVPDTVDWRTKGYVTPVKDQGQCGSCWAFSTTGSIEGQHAKKTGQLVSLSEQQLVDCSGRYGNKGCNGGNVNEAFKYVQAVGGIEKESSYPYERRGARCRFDRSLAVVQVLGYTNVPRNEASLKTAVGSVGPVSVAIDASQRSFQSYRSGIYNEMACSSTRLDHAVLAVGYGTEGTSDYWLVKNSWGTRWGIQGYIKMSRNKRNQCGIASDASYPKTS
uniref:Cathepsin L4 n=1 Tax=Sinonovacula constricta TaxID=98310 RepID=R4N047_SINCO|nr:cathepsin L4 [Sinonovacula constricta]